MTSKAAINLIHPWIEPMPIEAYWVNMNLPIVCANDFYGVLDVDEILKQNKKWLERSG